MTENMWMAVISSLLTVIAFLWVAGVKDITRRIQKLEKQDSKLNAAILTLLIAKSDDPDAVAAALHGLLTNGIETTSH